MNNLEKLADEFKERKENNKILKYFRKKYKLGCNKKDKFKTNKLLEKYKEGKVERFEVIKYLSALLKDSYLEGKRTVRIYNIDKKDFDKLLERQK